MFDDIVSYARKAVNDTLCERGNDRLLYAQVHQIHMIKLCHFFNAFNLEEFVDTAVVSTPNLSLITRMIDVVTGSYGLFQ